MKAILAVLALSALCPIAFSAEKKPVRDPAALAAVVAPRNTSLLKVNVTQQPWNYRIPWQKVSPSSRRGLGVLLEKRQILVTAQLIADATYIELEQADSGRKLPAKVRAVDYDANLALLEPTEDPGKFFNALKPLTVETNARIGDRLEVWQLDRVGELITSEVVISKIMTSRYFLDTSMFLVYEANNIIRSEANSFTLPVIKGGKLAGLLLSYDSKNLSSLVLPGPIIAHFLKDITDGNYQGFPSLGIEFQKTLDPQFREYLGMTDEQDGIYVSAVSKGGSAESIGIKVGDIILEMNGHAVDARGDYNDARFGRLNISHIVRGQSFVGDEIKVKILRGGKVENLTGKLTRKLPKDYLVPPYLFDRGANFLVQGGLVFQELSMPFLQSFGADWETNAPLRLVFVAKHSDDYEKKGFRKVVVLTNTLPTRSTQGYERLAGVILTRVNGHPVADLADLEKAFKDPQDGIHKLEFEEAPRTIYLDAITCERDNLRLLEGVYRLGSLKRID